MYYYNDSTIFGTASLDGTADRAGTWIDGTGMSEAQFIVAWTAATSVTGVVYVEVTNDDAKAAANCTKVTLPTGSVHTATSGVALTSGQVVLTAAVSGNVAIKIACPGKWFRVYWDFGSNVGAVVLNGSAYAH